MPESNILLSSQLQSTVVAIISDEKGVWVKKCPDGYYK